MSILGLFKKHELEKPPVFEPPHPPSFEHIEPVSFSDMPSFQNIPSHPTFDDAPQRIPDLALPEPPGKESRTDLKVPVFETSKKIPVMTADFAHIPHLEGATEEPLPPSRTPLPQGPLFLRVGTFKKSIEGLNDAIIGSNAAEEHFTDIATTKTAQDIQFEHLREIFEDMERKLLFIDKTLFERN